MTSFDLNSITQALSDPKRVTCGVDFSGKSLKLDTEEDAQPIVNAINQCPDLQYLTLTGNTLGVSAAQAIAKALEHHPEFRIARFSDMFTGRMKTEIPPALKALGDGMITAGARLQVLDLSDNAFGPIGVEGLAKLLESEVCSELQELRLNNNGLGITGGRLLAKALLSSPRRLKVFIAGRNRLENDGAKALAGVFKKMNTLETLEMPQNGIYHVGILALSAALWQNPRLSCLNLNDNTIGAKGAEAIAAALPSLKNLKSINFGDCLLKSKGAMVLAKAFREHSHSLEVLNLSHNEIGRDACMEVVDAITEGKSSADTLFRVVLVGNSLGGTEKKVVIRKKLGEAAELSDGEDSGNEYETDSEEEEEEEDEDEQSDESDLSDENNENNVTSINITDVTLISDLDISVYEIDTDVGRFLREPTVQSLERLGPNAEEVIDSNLQSIKDPSASIQAYVEATFCVSGLSTESATAKAIALRLYPILLKRAGQHHAVAWLLANNMLRGLKLIKSEDKDYNIRWLLPGCFSVLGSVISLPLFPAALRDTLRFFVGSKLAGLPPAVAAAIREHPALTD